MGSIQGAVPLIYREEAHHNFVDAVHPHTALVKFNHARQYVRHDDATAADVFPEDTRVITTTTINDTALSYLPWKEELEILREFQPDYHIPADYPTYRSSADYTLKEYVQKMAEGLLEIVDGLDKHRDEFDSGPPELIPLARKYLGKTAPGESVPNPVDLGANLGLQQFAFYATQHYADGGDFKKRILKDLQMATRALPDDASLFVIGALSPWMVKALPPEVDAVAGLNAWRTAADPTTSSPATMRESFEELATTVNAELGVTAPASLHPDAPTESITANAEPTARTLRDFAESQSGK
jgi:hypothetical protein